MAAFRMMSHCSRVRLRSAAAAASRTRSSLLVPITGTTRAGCAMTQARANRSGVWPPSSAPTCVSAARKPSVRWCLPCNSRPPPSGDQAIGAMRNRWH